MFQYLFKQQLIKHLFSRSITIVRILVCDNGIYNRNSFEIHQINLYKNTSVYLGPWPQASGTHIRQTARVHVTTIKSCGFILLQFIVQNISRTINTMMYHNISNSYHFIFISQYTYTIMQFHFADAYCSISCHNYTHLRRIGLDRIHRQSLPKQQLHHSKGRIPKDLPGR